jgi:hypothetical protein
MPEVERGEQDEAWEKTATPKGWLPVFREFPVKMVKKVAFCATC